MRNAARLHALVLVLATPWASGAQQPPKPRFEGRVEVTEVLLDVLALDRKDQVVTGLGKDDFIVRENGQPVELTDVSFYTNRYGPEVEESPSELEGIPASRYLIFFFHDQARLGAANSLVLRQQRRASRESQRWVETSMMPSDWVAVVSYDFKLKVHRDFTQDRTAILQAIEDAGLGRDPEKGMGRRGRALPTLGAPSLLRQLPQSKELRKETGLIYGGLRLVAEAAGNVVGRKNLILFSLGFGELDPGGLPPQPDQRYYPGMVRTFNDHNVAIYCIDLAPLEVEHAQADFLSRLASETGGDYYENFVNFATPLERISRENGGYYLLSYRSEHPAGEAGYQDVSVRARDRSLRLRARKGYRYGDRGDG